MSPASSNRPTVAEIARAVEEWAPPASAQSYDNVGLQIGRPEREVARGLIALDLTPRVVDEAVRDEADLVITHHPLLFRPLKSLSPTTLPGALALRMAESGIALYSAHTNLDAAIGGVSFVLAAHLGLVDVGLLSPLEESLYKVVSFVPPDHLTGVREALAAAGAGQIGEYDACAFALEGSGFFRAGAAAKPFVGTAGGGIERVMEARLEVEVARWKLDEVLSALRAAHPYEEVAYDVYPVLQPSTRVGLGAFGELSQPETLGSFLERVADRLGTSSIRFVGDRSAVLRRIAVCGGAGADLVSAARRAGAHALVTADVSYHRFFDVLDGTGAIRMALLDVGHYESEAPTEQLLVDWLSERFPAVSWRRTAVRTSPVAVFVPGKEV